MMDGGGALLEGHRGSWGLSVARLVGAVSLGVCLLLMAVRLYFGTSLDHPLFIVTSGSEWESLFVVWRVVHQLPAFLDRLEPPYAASTYNWLFYYLYGYVCKIVLQAMNLGEAWLPQVARFLTLFLTTMAWGAALVLFRRCLPAERRWIAWQMSAFFAFGPLIGYWAFTTRADVGAVACEVMAIAAFLHIRQRRPVLAALFLGLLGYAAFAFKQPNISALVAGGTLLLVRREWLPLSVAVVTAGGLAAVTFLLGSHQYVLDVLMVGFTIVRDWARGARQIIIFAEKSGPTLLCLPVVGWLVVQKIGLRRLIADDVLVVGAVGSLSALTIVLATIFHNGSADNYLFPISFYLALLTVRCLGLTLELFNTLPTVVAAAWSLGWASLAAAVMVVLTGMHGTYDLSHEHEDNVRGLACLRELPGPVLVAGIGGYGLLNLPWMLPGRSGWVVSFQYDAERRVGIPFKEGGISAFVDRGYFGTVASVSGGGLPDQLDSRMPAPYRPHISTDCKGMNVWVRQEN